MQANGQRLSWRPRRDQWGNTCFLSDFCQDRGGRYILSPDVEFQWRLHFDQLGSAKPSEIDAGDLAELRTKAELHCAARI